MTVIEELRAKFPGLAKAVDRGSRAAAIKLNCFLCMGGDTGEARRCQSKDCPLWPFGPAGRKARGEAEDDDATGAETESEPCA